MKKFFLYWMTIMVVAILSIGITSCSKDDDDDGSSPSTELVNQLQGTWQFSKGTENMMGMTITLDRSSLSQLKSQMEQIMGERVEFWDETLTFSSSKLNGVNYKLDGRKIILDGIDDSDGITVSVKSVTSSTLVLREEFNMEGLELTADMEYSKK